MCPEYECRQFEVRGFFFVIVGFLPAVAHEARDAEEGDAGQQALRVALWKNIGVFEPSGNAFSAVLAYD